MHHNCSWKEGISCIDASHPKGIKDLRTQLVSLTLQIDQKNELLADKGELIDTLR